MQIQRFAAGRPCAGGAKVLWGLLAAVISLGPASGESLALSPATQPAAGLRSPSTGGSLADEDALLRAAREKEAALVSVIDQLLPAFVVIGGGSGVLISDDGLMLTNHHVAGMRRRWQVRVENKIFTADVLGSDPRGDITLLKLRDVRNMAHVKLGDSDRLRVGQPVIAIGNPFGTAEVAGEPTVTTGVISALNRFAGNYTDAIQTDAPINPGNSGGPLLTLDGKLIGINGQIRTRFGARANTGIGLAIPVNQIKRFLPLLTRANAGNVHPGLFRGITVDEEAVGARQDGVVIKSVAPGSPAEKAGLRAGDKITHLGGERVRNLFRFRGIQGTYPEGSQLSLRYRRGSASRSVSVTLEPHVPGTLGMSIARSRRAMRVADPARVGEVVPDHAAARAGLKTGDRILSINGFPAETVGQYVEFLRGLEPLAGDRLVVRVLRGEGDDEEELEVQMTLRPQAELPRARRQEE